jgi:hypothetical protein
MEGVIIDSDRPTDGLRGRDDLYPATRGFDGTTLMKTSSVTAAIREDMVKE